MPDRADAPAEETISFGPFRLFPRRQLLLEDDRPVRVGSRALEILAALVARPGELVGKDELFALVWPDTFVEEGNLRVHVAALRRALGDGQGGRRFLATIPGRGYRFVAPVSVSEAPAAPAPARPPEAPSHNLPTALTRMVGRDTVVDTLVAQLPQRRILTLVGPGGIGKTAVAVAVGEAAAAAYGDGVRFIDLAPLRDPPLVATALASALGEAVRSENPAPGLVAILRGQQALLILDNCEHVIEAAASLAEQIVRGAPLVHILATSREPLRVEGEHVVRLPPLPVPAAAGALTAAEAIASPAVQLFVERATATLEAFELSDANAPQVAEICRRLDGIPLALELAAGRIDAFGVAGLAARLGDRLQLLMRGRRTALPRHQTLSATLDWSHAQLAELERLVLRRLAVFVGSFSIESAAAVLADTGIPSVDAIDAIANLVTKSLLAADIDRPIPSYRLFDVTRVYAAAKLEESAERDRLSELHAAHYRQLLERAERDWERLPAAQWLEEHRHLIDNVRAALDWCFSPAGDAATGAALTAAAVPLWFGLSLVSECAERVDQALASPAASRSPDSEMRLCAARAWSLMQTRGFVDETRTVWAQVLELAERQESVDYQLRALWGLWAGLQNRSELVPALALAERFSALAAAHGEPADIHVGDRMVGYILHLMGEQTRARQYLERMIGGYEVPVIGARMIRFVFDQRATAQCFLARILWLQGSAGQAERLATSLVDGAVGARDVLSLCQVLVQAACPVAFFLGDMAAADRYVTMLVESSERQGLEFWQAYGHCFRAVLAIRRGQVDEGLGLLGSALGELRGIQFGVLYGVFLCELAAALGRSGRPEEGHAAIDEALARSRRNQELWYVAELLRIKGELALGQGGPGSAEEAERHFLESLDWSRRQQTPAWELRAATSLARLRRDGAVLAPVYAGFSEGLETADLRAARALLRSLGGASA